MGGFHLHNELMEEANAVCQYWHAVSRSSWIYEG